MIKARRANLVNKEIDPRTKDISLLKKEEQMRKTLEKTGVRDDIPLEVSENKIKAKEDSKKKHQKYQMTEEEFEIWLEMLCLARKYFSDIRIFKGKKTHPDWDSVFMEYKVRLWKLPRTGSKSMACVSSRSKTIWLRKNREEDELKCSLLHEILHIYCRNIPENTSQLMTAVFYDWAKRFNETVKEILFQETIADNPLLDDSDYQDLSLDALESLKKEKRTHSSLFIIKSIDLDEKLDKPYGTVYGYGQVDFFEGIRKGVDPNCKREKLREKLMNSPYLQGMIQNEIDQINWEAENLDYDEYNESDWESWWEDI